MSCGLPNSLLKKDMMRSLWMMGQPETDELDCDVLRMGVDGEFFGLGKAN